MTRGGSSGVAKSDSNLPKVPDPEVMGGCLPMPPPQTPAPPDAHCTHTQCICMHTPPLHPSTPPGAERTSKEDWGQARKTGVRGLAGLLCPSSPASAGPMLGAVCSLTQNSPASLKDGDCHPHFIDEESMARVGPQGEAQPSFLVPEPSLLRQKSFHCTEKSVGATLFFFFLSSWLLGGGPEGRDSRQAEFSSLR